MSTATKNVAVINGAVKTGKQIKAYQLIEKQLNSFFLERRSVIRALMAAFIAGEHVFMIGEPGGGKTLLADKFGRMVAGDSVFNLLLMKSTAPDELLGNVKYSSFKNDLQERNIDGYLPSVRFAILDEIWKGNSTALNALLKAVNERIVKQGATDLDIPLEMVTAMSNEYPEEKVLDALYDRFMVRMYVPCLQDSDSMRTLWKRRMKLENVPVLDATISQADIEVLRKAVDNFGWSAGDVDIFDAIKNELVKEGFVPSTRTWERAPKMIAANAVIDGRNHTVPSDFLMLADMLWNRHTDRDQLFEIIGNAADPYGSRAISILDGIRAAMVEVPDFKMLKSGTMTKTQFLKALTDVQIMLSSENTKIQDLEEATIDNASVTEARDKWNAAKSVVDEAMNKAFSHR